MKSEAPAMGLFLSEDVSGELVIQQVLDIGGVNDLSFGAILFKSRNGKPFLFRNFLVILFLGRMIWKNSIKGPAK